MTGQCLHRSDIVDMISCDSGVTKSSAMLTGVYGLNEKVAESCRINE